MEYTLEAKMKLNLHVFLNGKSTSLGEWLYPMSWITNNIN